MNCIKCGGFGNRKHPRPSVRLRGAASGIINSTGANCLTSLINNFNFRVIYVSSWQPGK